MQNNTQEYVATWRTKYSEYTLNCFCRTKEEALKRAMGFGYESPKWYEFWKPRIKIITWSRDN